MSHDSEGQGQPNQKDAEEQENNHGKAEDDVLPYNPSGFAGEPEQVREPGEVIPHQYDISCFQSHIRSCCTHCDSQVTDSKCRCIVYPVTYHCHGALLL